MVNESQLGEVHIKLNIVKGVGLLKTGTLSLEKLLDVDMSHSHIACS